MCDCYHARCKVCGRYLPVHLGDYNTKRNEIEVFCQEHLPNTDIKIFTLSEASSNNHVPKNISDDEKADIKRKRTELFGDDDSLESLDWYLDHITEHVEYPVGWKMGIRCLTPNAKKHEVMNHPNLGIDWNEEIYQNF